MRKFFSVICLGLAAVTSCHAAELCPATLSTEQHALNVSDTEIALIQKLPGKLTSCTVHFIDARHVLLQGMPVISSAECE
jgi:hypothetical protein